MKNKWLSGVRFEIGSWWCHTDGRAQAQKVCNTPRLEEGENVGTLTMMEITGNVQPGKATGQTRMDPWRSPIHGGSDPHTLHLYYY